jgi:rubrerythrin
MKLNKTEMENYRKFSKMNMSIHSCKIDQLNIHLNGDFEHELEKFKLYWKLRKEGKRVITEAWQRGTDFRRDLVDITDGEIYEVVDKHESHEQVLEHRKNFINVVILNPFTCKVCGLTYPIRNKKKICSNCAKEKI